MRVTRDEALALSTGLLEGRNTPAKCALLQSDILVEAELRGHPSHGLQRLPRLLTRIERGLTDPRTEGVASWRSDAVLQVDGMKGLGPVVAFAALRHLETRVATSGVALTAIRNSNHLGMLACYVEQIASWGCIGIAMSSSEALVHPHGGTRAMLGTNPIAIAVPTAERPMVLDLATSTVSMGKIHYHAANGMPLPSGWARDAAGRPTSSAAAAKQGSIAPFGGAKGYGLGLAVELVVAALAGSELAPNVRGTLDAEFVCNKGDVLIAIHLGHAPDLAAKLSAYLELMRRSPAADPEQPVSIPGDGAALRRAIALEQGFEIEPQLWHDLNALSRTSVIEGHSA